MNKIFLFGLIFIVLGAIVIVAKVKAQDAEIMIPIKRFAEVDANLYRGAQPDEAGFRALKEMGIKRIINFRSERDLAAEEKALVEKLGLEYINIPWTIYSFYNHSVFERFFESLKDKDTAPIFFHCKRGSERTGVISAAYKIKFKDYSLREAIKDTRGFDVKFIWRAAVHTKIKQFYKIFHAK